MKIKKLLLNHSNIKSKKIVAVIGVCILILVSVLSIHILTKYDSPNFILNDNKIIKLEYGEKYSVDAMKLLNINGMDEEEKKELAKGLSVESNFKYEEAKDYPAIGKYKITMTFNDEKLIKRVNVVDTTAPELNTKYKSVDIVKGTDLNKYDFSGLNLFSVNDLSPIEIEYDSSAINSNVVGTYLLKTIAKDSSGNETKKELVINITEAPNENQELVIETITNDDGTKSIRNTLKDKTIAQNNVNVSDGSGSSTTSNSNIKRSTGYVINNTNNRVSSNTSNSNTGNSTNHKGTTDSSSNNSSSSSNSNVSQSFVANMSIARRTTQAITVIGNGGSNATLVLHTKHNGVWSETLRCSARVGRNGITSSKREGDGKTPSGIYSFGQAFGVAGNPGTSRSWLKVNNNHYWVDDVNSSYYNKLVDASQIGIKWSSAEHLISYPTAYRYAIAINYNTTCIRGVGSAIFLHCSTGGSTAGCVSVAQSNMIRILQLLQGDTLIGIYQNSNSLY